MAIHRIRRPDLVRLTSPLAQKWREHGHNAESLAVAVGASVGHVYNLAAGRSTPSHSLLAALCSELECRADELFPALTGTTGGRGENDHPAPD